MSFFTRRHSSTNTCASRSKSSQELGGKEGDGKIDFVSLSQIKTAIKQLSFEERAELAAWLHGWNDDEWDDQMKRDIASGKLDDVLREVEEDIKAEHTREMP